MKKFTFDDIRVGSLLLGNLKSYCIITKKDDKFVEGYNVNRNYAFFKVYYKDLADNFSELLVR